MKIVMDTNVLVSGLSVNSGASFQILKLTGNGQLPLLMSVPLFLEYEAVLMRPSIRSLLNLNDQEVEAVLGVLARNIIPVKYHYRWRPQLKDPNDEMVLETAINGHAEVIVTFNVRDFVPATGNFGIAIQQPGEFLNKLELED